MVIMATLFVRDVEKFELQSGSSQRDLKICPSYRNFPITEIRITEGNYKSFLRNFTVTLNLCELGRNSNHGDSN